MSRYDYNASKVNSAKETLTNAKNTISGTASEFSSALSQIVAASKGYLEIDTATLPAIPEEVNNSIDAMVSLIAEKQSMIEEYNSSAWYEKLFGSVGMGITKIGEGLGTAVETLVDGATTIVGGVGGLFSSDFQDSCAEFIKKDHVGDYFADQYENGALKWINDKSTFSHTSTGANVFKGVGVAAGYVGVAVATGGSSLGVQAGVAGLGGLGSGTQSGLQSGLSFKDASIQGAKQGAIQAGTVFVAGQIANKISSSGVVGKVGDKIKTTTSNIENKIGTKVLGKETVESLATEGVSPAGYAKEVLKTKAGNATNKITTPIKSAATNVENKIGTKVLGKETVESLATEGVSPAGYAKEVFKTKAGNATNKITTPIKSAATNVENKIGTRVLGKETVESLATEGVSPAGYAKEVLKTKIGSTTSALKNGVTTIGTTAVTSPVAKGAFAANAVTQTGVENAKSQARIANSTDHISVNRDLPETLASEKAFESKTPSKKEEPSEQPNEKAETPATNDAAENGGTNNGGNGGTPAGNGNSIQPRYTNDGGDVRPRLDNSNTPTAAELGVTKPTKPIKVPTEVTEAPTTPTETPTTPETPTPPADNTPTVPDTSGGDSSGGGSTVPPADNTVPVDNGGNNSNYVPSNNSGNSNSGGNYTASNSATGGFNSNSAPASADSSLSYETKPGVDIGDSGSLVDTTTGSELDVISIDKGGSTTPKATGSGSNVIPIGLGVAAAAAAGVAGVHYIKNRNDNKEDDDNYEDEGSSFSYLSDYNSLDNGTSEYSSNSYIENQQTTEDNSYNMPKYKAGTVNKLVLDDGADVKTSPESSIIAPQNEELE